MSVVSGDIVVYAAANMPEADTGAVGGAIDATTKIVFTDIGTTDQVAAVSDSATDTSSSLLITGRSAGGSIVTDTITINGLMNQTGTVAFERILKVEEQAGAHSGTITVHQANEPTNTAIGTLPSGVTSFRRPFYGAVANVSGGDDKDLYEKVFIKNNNITNALLSMTVEATSDPSGLLGFDLEADQNGTGLLGQRLGITPTGVLGSGFTDTLKGIPNTDLSAGSGVGVWLHLDLNAGTSAAKTTYTLNVAGNTT